MFGAHNVLSLVFWTRSASLLRQLALFFEREEAVQMPPHGFQKALKRLLAIAKWADTDQTQMCPFVEVE